MKKIILLFCFLSLSALSGPVVFFNPISSPVTNRVTSYAPTVDEVAYYGVTGALIITNRSAQIGLGVTTTNITSMCVVDGQNVRLMTGDELQMIVDTNALLAAEAALQAKIDARSFASNVVVGTDGLSLYIRSMGEANWFLLNNLRTNAGLPALTKGVYKTMVETNINTFGQ